MCLRKSVSTSVWVDFVEYFSQVNDLEFECTVHTIANIARIKEKRKLMADGNDSNSNSDKRAIVQKTTDLKEKEKKEKENPKPQK